MTERGKKEWYEADSERWCVVTEKRESWWPGRRSVSLGDSLDGVFQTSGHDNLVSTTISMF